MNEIIWKRVLLTIIGMQVFFIFLLPILKVATFHSHYGDLGLFDHFLYIFSKEDNFYWFLKNHFRPILFLYGEIYKLLPSPYVLLFIQSLTIVLSGYIVFKIAYEIIGKEIDALLFLFAFYLHPMILYNAFWDLKTEHLFIFFSLLAFYVVFTKQIEIKWKSVILMILFLILITIKESVAFFILFFSIFLIFKKFYKSGFFGLFFSLLAFYFITKYIAPDFLKFKNTLFETWPVPEKSPFPPYYRVWGNSYEELITNVLDHPWSVIKWIFSNKHKIIFIVVSLLPFWFLPFLAPDVFLVSITGYAIVLLSSAPHTYEVASHYGAMVIPIIFVASIVGYKKLLTKFPYLRCILIIAIVISTLFVSWAYAPTPNGRYFYWTDINDYGYDKYFPNRTEEKEAVLRYIPSDYNVSVALSYQTYLPHLGHRRRVYILPNGIEEASYIVIDMNRITPHEEKLYRRTLQEIEAKRGLLIQINGLYIFH